MSGPRICHSWEEFAKEVQRYRELGGKGWLRRLGDPCGFTVEWAQGNLDGHRAWAWTSGDHRYWGGVWPRAEDADEAFRLAEFEWEHRACSSKKEE